MSDAQPQASSAATRRGPLIERFGATPTRLVGLFAITVALFVCGDVVRDGLSSADLVVLSLAVFGATLAWMILVRPRLVAYQRVLLIHNIASDIELPWHLVIGAEARQTLRFYTEEDTFHAVGIVKTTRQVIRASRGPVLGSLMGTAAEVPGLGVGGASAGFYQDRVAARVMKIAGDQHLASRGLDNVVRRWAVPEIAVLLLSALASVVLSMVG